MCHATNITSIEGQRRDALDVVALPTGRHIRTTGQLASTALPARVVRRVSDGDVNHSVWGESGVVIDGESLIPAYVQAAYLMRGFIIARQLPVGSLLPSEASLQARWGISRDTARKAYAVLDESGMTETRRAVGHLVKRLPSTEYVQAPPGSRITARPPTAQERREVQGGVPSRRSGHHRRGAGQATGRLRGGVHGDLRLRTSPLAMSIDASTETSGSAPERRQFTGSVVSMTREPMAAGIAVPLRKFQSRPAMRLAALAAPSVATGR